VSIRLCEVFFMVGMVLVCVKKIGCFCDLGNKWVTFL